MIRLAPSILAADFANLGEAVKTVTEAGCEVIHVDVMDGSFVPNISIGPGVIKSIRPYSDSFFDVHLMIDEPIRYIDKFVDAGADGITVHFEACEDLDATLRKIESYGVKVGVSIKPATSPEVLKPYLDRLDLVLIMSVNPGFGGQSFIPSALEDIAYIKSLAESMNKDLQIEVDGGIYQHNVEQVLEAGANLIVAGTAVFKDHAIGENVEAFNRIFEKYQ